MIAAPYVHVAGRGLGVAEAFKQAAELVESAGGPVEVVGSYVVPPADGSPTRPFQTLHVDFGLPLAPVRPTDVATHTALHVPLDAPTDGALTRLVPLDTLLAQRPWPEAGELVQRLQDYGRTHGAWDDADGYTEGSLARLLEAAAGAEPRLPSVKAEPGFRCGLEFASAEAETRHLEGLGLDVAAVSVDVLISPGDLLIFDNHAVAHGRIGRRLPGELHQRFYGVRAAPVTEQLRVRDRLLARFARRRS